MTADYHSIIGLPGSGKTTFLAALWHLIDAREVSTEIVLDRLVGDHSYLNEIVEAWRECREVPRTSLATDARVSVHVRDVKADRSFVLSFPDLSGEVFNEQLSTRSCSDAYVADYEHDGGVLLFVTADRAQEGVTLNDIGPIVGATEETESQEVDGETPIKWSPEFVPEQVRLVELLQFLQMAPFPRRRRRLAVAVSAWDLVKADGITPENWLNREMPFLYQYLISNTDAFEMSVFGVSAQGGDVTSDAREGLLRITPSEKVLCVGEEADPHDLTAPVRWLASED